MITHLDFINSEKNLIFKTIYSIYFYALLIKANIFPEGMDGWVVGSTKVNEPLGTDVKLFSRKNYYNSMHCKG